MDANSLVDLCKDINEWKYKSGRLNPDCTLKHLAENLQYWELRDLEMSKLTDYSQTVKMNKAQLISFIYDLCDEYLKTNVNEYDGDISYNLGVKDTVEGLRNYIRININEIS